MLWWPYIFVNARIVSHYQRVSMTDFESGSGRRTTGTHLTPAAVIREEDAPDLPPRRVWLPRGIIAAIILLVLGPILYTGIPGEVARWYQAAAFEQRLTGDFERAYRLLDQSLTWAPDDAGAYALRAEWKLAQKDYRGSLEDYDRALELDPDQTHASVQRTQVLQHLGRRPEAVVFWEQLERQSGDSSPSARAMVLNGLAYARAVAGGDEAELREALKNIERAIELWDQSQSMMSLLEERKPTQDDAALQDTRGYLRFLLGDLEQARQDLDQALEIIVKVLEETETTTAYIDRREFQLSLKQVRENAAVMYHHRAQVLEKLGKVKLAETDRRRVRELGFEPNDDLF